MVKHHKSQTEVQNDTNSYLLVKQKLTSAEVPQ